MADSEGPLVSELKDNRHALGRARRRGRAAFHVQLLVGSTAVNLKRLASYGGLAAEGVAAGTSSERAAPLAYAAPRFYQQSSVWRPVCRSAVLAPSSQRAARLETQPLAQLIPDAVLGQALKPVGRG